MRFDVVTLFPELFAPHLTLGVTRRAYAADGIDVRLWPLRDFAEDAYRRVDDRPYGGGPGMVMLVEPLVRALAAIRADRAGGTAAADAAPEAGAAPLPVVHFTPTGRRIDQAVVREFAAGPGAVLICARYEGIDQRFIDRCVTHELSLGDFVLSGGELPALALLDAVARLQEGVLRPESHRQDSFSESGAGTPATSAGAGEAMDGLLEGPHYSRPERLALEGDVAEVPAVLLSGHHAAIARWRRERSLELTARRRPELIERARAAGRLSAADEKFLATL
ncbi:MAG: tRNA (guanosine(37)-N1)-methyltransferase TrmD [Rubrivivax sp.]|jgi:tRNA (guanine37-N1)-methyltransferase|nr:tRNA (guanosine(37)-N1)-methyltransferase TrmD [Rubrivivax sp.]MCL4697953.1 tRNA (guanosine(37)-N1)-methyltransferase TrmD [Burkholderiaceae bacterium]